MKRWFVILWILAWAAGGGAWAAVPAETAMFDAAMRGFQDHNYKYSDETFGEFVRTFPTAEKLTDAIVLQARSRFELRNFDGVIELLNASMPQAGKKADEFLFWLAQAEFEKADYRASAATFEKLLGSFAGSPFRLRATVGQALALYQARDLKRAVEVLSAPNGHFLQAAAAAPNDPTAIRGHLLRAEALLTLGENAAALAALTPLSNASLPPNSLWQREQLLARVQLANQQTNAALVAITNALGAAAQAKSTELGARSYDLIGRVLEGLGNVDAALAAFTNNLSSTAPESLRRQALAKVFELNIARGNPNEAARLLEAFVEAGPQDPLLDLARLTLGEIRLRQFRELPEARRMEGLTNQIPRALAQFDQVITNFPNSPLRGRAHLQRGWCWWEDAQLRPDASRVSQSLAEFQAAADRLPISDDQATARFKLADCFFLQKDYPQAITNYQSVLDQYANLPRIKATLFDQALYQIVRASLEINDVNRATDAMEKIIKSYPDSFFGDRSLLLVGQSLNRSGDPAKARDLFEKYLAKLPDSKLQAELQLAIARTHVQETNWAAAAQDYDRLAALPTVTNIQGKVEFERSWVHYKAGNESNAFGLFTNYLARFSSDTNAPLALFWLGDYNFNQAQYPAAEKNYRLIADNTNWPPELTLRARMAAGRSAVARLGYKEAREDFQRIINDPRCPPDLSIEALFALGDVTMIEDAAGGDPAKQTERYENAIVIFDRVRKSVTNYMTALAWGKIGNCHFQLATGSNLVERCEQAAAAYQNAMTNEFADITTRSEAEAGLGMVREKQGKPDQALKHFSNVLYMQNLRPNETADRVWQLFAGNKALKIVDEQKNWALIVKLCDRLLSLQPDERETLQAKRDKAQEQLLISNGKK